MASAGAREYNGGLGRSPHAAGVQVERPPVGGQGAKPPDADEAFVFKTAIFNGSAAVVHEMMYNLYF